MMKPRLPPVSGKKATHGAASTGRHEHKGNNIIIQKNVFDFMRWWISLHNKEEIYQRLRVFKEGLTSGLWGRSEADLNVTYHDGKHGSLNQILRRLSQDSYILRKLCIESERIKSLPLVVMRGPTPVAPLSDTGITLRREEGAGERR
jgi:hypothetical protein